MHSKMNLMALKYFSSRSEMCIFNWSIISFGWTSQRVYHIKCTGKTSQTTMCFTFRIYLKVSFKENIFFKCSRLFVKSVFLIVESLHINLRRSHKYFILSFKISHCMVWFYVLWCDLFYLILKWSEFVNVMFSKQIFWKHKNNWLWEENPLFYFSNSCQKETKGQKKSNICFKN